MSVKNPEKLVQIIVETMRQQAKEAHTNKAEIDISGGIDSAVVAALSCLAFAPENVIGVYSSIDSSPESQRRAILTAKAFGFKLVELDLTYIYEKIVEVVKDEFEFLNISVPSPEDNPTIYGGLRSCLRAPIGRFINRMFGGGIRQGTGNRDEDDLLRFYQKGGDGEVDCNWIGGLFKSEVWELAEYLGVPKEIVDAKPTPDLWGSGDTHNDEDELKEITGVDLTYGRPGEEMGTIEWIIREDDRCGIITGHNKHRREDVDDEWTPEQWKIIEAVRKMEKVTRHKAELPPKINRGVLLSAGAVE
jgi:NAD+ synthetase